MAVLLEVTVVPFRVNEIVSPVANVILLPLSSLVISVCSYTSSCFPATASFNASIALFTADSPEPLTASVIVVLDPACSVVPDTSLRSPIVNDVPGIIESIFIVPFNTSTFEVLILYVDPVPLLFAVSLTV